MCFVTLGQFPNKGQTQCTLYEGKNLVTLGTIKWNNIMITYLRNATFFMFFFKFTFTKIFYRNIYLDNPSHIVFICKESKANIIHV